MQIIKDSLIYKVKLKKYECLLACNNTNGNKNKKAYSKNIFCGITLREIGHVISSVDNYPLAARFPIDLMFQNSHTPGSQL